MDHPLGESLELRCRHASPDDVGSIADLFTGIGSTKNREELIWHYLSAPAGPALIASAFPSGDDRLAASYALLPIIFKVAGERLVAYQSFDTATAASFRGQGLFSTLAALAYAEAEREGAGLVYGFPNEASGPGFYRRLAWSSLGSYPLLIRPLRTAFVYGSSRQARQPLRNLSRHTARTCWETAAGTVQLTSVLPEDIDELADRFGSRYEVGTVRDRAYLQWRLIDSPRADTYQLLTLRHRGRLTGFGALARVERHGRPLAYILECMADLEARGSLRALLQAMVLMARVGKASAIMALSAKKSITRGPLKRAGFWVPPERLRPIHLTIGYRVLDDNARSELLGKPSNWYLSYLDSDTI